MTDTTTAITVRATKNFGLVSAGDTFKAKVNALGRVEIEGLPKWTAHPILFLDKGQVSTWTCPTTGTVYRMGDWSAWELV